MGIDADRDVVLLVGRRAGAIRAAERLGVDTIVLTDVRVDAAIGAGRGRGARAGRAKVAFEDADALRAVAADIDSARVRAVVPLTERAVVAAAVLREALGVPGQPLAAALRCTDKVQMKRVATEGGLACARFVTAEEGLAREEIVARLGLPFVVKERSSSGGRGTWVARTVEEVPDPLHDGTMAESFVSGFEMSIEMLVADGRVVFVNPTEYFRPGWANILPAVPPADTLERVVDVAHRAVAALGLRDGIAHTEVYVDGDHVVFGETANRPPGGHIMELIQRAYGFDPWEALLLLAVGHTPEIPTCARRAAGVWLLHPGPGRIVVADASAARAMPGVVHLPLRVGPGETVDSRVGVGQEVGHIVVEGRDRDEVAARLEAAHAAVRISVSD